MSRIIDPIWSRQDRAFLCGMSTADAGSVSILDDGVARAMIDAELHKWDKSRLYYEAHITVEPATDRTFDQFRFAWSDDTWRVSSFSEDDVDQIEGKWFITCRHTSYQMIHTRVHNKVRELTEAGLTVQRYKIEDTLLDSKHGDTL